MSSTVIIAGGTGFIGSVLSKELISKGYNVLIISRKIPDIEKDENITYKTWDSLQSVDFEDVSALINLAGASLAAGKWTDSYKKIIIDSRVNSTRALVEFVSKTKKPPKVFINASAVGYYGDRADEVLIESSSSGQGFLAKVCIEWENEAINASKYTRTVIARIGVVLDKNEGALSKMLLPFRFFAGGPLGRGNQYFPWIHIKDIIGLFIFAIENNSLNGSMNFTSPKPVTMNEFAKTLGKVMKKPSIFKVPEAVLKIMLGESAEMITNSQRVNPEIALSNGYDFRFADVNEALYDIISQ